VEQGIKNKINLYAVCLLALLIPYKFIVPPVIAIWFIYQLTQYKQINWKGFFTNVWMLLPLAYFLLHAAAYLFSYNKQEALFSIEVKLSFLFLPFLFYNATFTRKDFNTIAFTFVASNLLAVLICSIHSLLNYFSVGDLLTYNSYSLFLHPSYFAMYLVFSLIVLLVLDVQILKSRIASIILVSAAAMLIVSGIVFSASKMGLLSLGLIIPAILFYKLIRAKKFIISIALLLILIVSGIALFNTTFSPIQRLKNAFSFYNSNQAIDKTTTESNAVRVLVWTEAIELIKKKPFVGYTPGDANGILYAAYQKAGLTGAFREHLNTHNQFLQTAVGLGLIGGILLLMQTIGLVVYGFIRKNIWTLLFGILIIVNFLVESMLQTEAGNLFFVFFYCLLLSVKDLTTKHNKELA